METYDLSGSMWFWISLPHATFAIHLTDGMVDSAPPIGRWSIGMGGEDVIERMLSIENSCIIRMGDYAEERGNPS